MNFHAKTEQEIEAARLWPAGIYDYVVISGADKTSKSSGAPMIELKIRLSKPDKTTLTITDYFVEKRLEKLLHASRAMGLEARYKSGSIAGSDFKGKAGRLKLGIEKGREGYKDKNVVLDYLCPEMGLVVQPKKSVEMILARYRR